MTSLENWYNDDVLCDTDPAAFIAKQGQSRIGLYSRGMYRKETRLKQMIVLMKEGAGNREIGRATGAHTWTVRKARSILEAEHGKFHCKCGKLATHRGWCWVRMAKSPKRQNVISEMHGERSARSAFKVLAFAGAIQ